LGLIRYLRPLYEEAIARMDTIITNSENVRSRIKKYLGIDSRVIYPPCETEKFKWLGQEDFYLSTARLDPLKRVDLVVKADPSPEEVIQAVQEITEKRAKDMRGACERRAKLFDKDVFVNRIRKVFGG
jgi:glycosyltransferase involved in cell wall biosynthesis